MVSNLHLNIFSLIVLFFMGFGNMFSQDNKIRSINSLQQIMDSIAGDATEGRFTGSKGYNKAAHYVKNSLKEIGVKPSYMDSIGGKSYFQPVPFIRYSYDSSTSVRVTNKDNNHIFSHLKYDFVLKNTYKNFTSDSPLSIVYIGYGIYEPTLGWNDYEGIDVSGKLVIIQSGIPNDENFSGALFKKYSNFKACEALKYRALIEHNAAAVIELPSKSAINDWKTYAIRQYRFNYMYYTDTISERNDISYEVPYFLINKEMGTYLMSDYESQLKDCNSFELKDMSININVKCKKEHINCKNVIGIIPGTEPKYKNEYLTVSAHLDHLGRYNEHIYNGANDDASGCALMLELTKLIVQEPLKRPLIFIFYTAEEIGMYGSEHFIRHPIIPLKEIAININIEQVGSENRTCSMVAIGSEQFKEPFVKASRLMDDSSYINSAENSDWIGNTDSYIYFENKIPSILVGSCGFPEHHKPEDKNDLIDFEHLYKSTQLIHSLLKNIDQQ